MPNMSDFTRRYRLEERIAVGGTAEVFHALFFPGDGSERPVVIKRVLPQFARDERFRRLFLEEACVAVTVTHPNIVKVLDHGELEQTCYIALERVEGMDLGELLGCARKSEGLPPANLSAFVVAQVGEALQFIHDQTSSEGTPLNIIHRDVSPQNILVSYSGDVKLTDFGIAKSTIRHDTTVDGTLRGKLEYMAPEQAALGDVDRRADLFALGCVLYELLQGFPPFRGKNELDTLDRLRNGRILVPPERLDTSRALREVLTRALQPDRELRYQRASEMVAALRGFMAAESASALRDALSRWARDLGRTRETSAPDAVEDAVRKLMGQGIGEDVEPGRGATAVFARPHDSASTRPSRTADPTQQVKPAPEIRTTPLPLTMALVALLGLLGWGLWAVRYFGAGPGGPNADATRIARVGGTDGTGGTGQTGGAGRVNGTGGTGQTGGAGRVDGTGGTGQTGGAGRVGGTGPDAALAANLPAKADSGARVAQTIRVQSRPPRALVLVNGTSVGHTPMDLALPDREFVLKLRKAGHRAWSQRIDPARPPAALKATLRPRRTGGAGFLTINSLPWSKVQVDGSYMGNTPLLRLRLPRGRHRVELRAPGGAVRKRFKVTIRPGKTVNRSFEFR